MKSCLSASSSPDPIPALYKCQSSQFSPLLCFRSGPGRRASRSPDGPCLAESPVVCRGRLHPKPSRARLAVSVSRHGEQVPLGQGSPRSEQRARASVTSWHVQHERFGLLGSRLRGDWRTCLTSWLTRNISWRGWDGVVTLQITVVLCPLPWAAAHTLAPGPPRPPAGPRPQGCICQGPLCPAGPRTQISVGVGPG